jgi:hypothetical protein
MVAVNPGHGGPGAGGKKKGKVVSLPPGTIVLDKSCVRCRVRKGESHVWLCVVHYGDTLGGREQDEETRWDGAVGFRRL